MILFLLACLGDVLTIVSPCILPVISFVLVRIPSGRDEIGGDFS
jgi:cytochrome c biogenesis protein CcdA